MQNTLIDAGPIIALFNKNDKYYKKITEFLKRYRGELISTWPVITEVSHMLGFSVQAQIDFLTWVHLGGIVVKTIEKEDIGRIIDRQKNILMFQWILPMLH